MTDGCIYVSAEYRRTGALIVQHGKILRVVFGVRGRRASSGKNLKEIAKDFNDEYRRTSENIRRDALEKFSYVSPIGAAGLYYHATQQIFREGEEREAFKAMIP